MELETSEALVQDALEVLVGQRARPMLLLALNEEVDSDLGRGRYQRIHGLRGDRGGVCLADQMMLRLSRNWRRLKSAHLCQAIPLPEVGRKKAKRAA